MKIKGFAERICVEIGKGGKKMLELLMAAGMLFGAMVGLPVLYLIIERAQEKAYLAARKRIMKEVQDNAHRDRRAS